MKKKGAKILLMMFKIRYVLTDYLASVQLWVLFGFVVFVSYTRNSYLESWQFSPTLLRLFWPSTWFSFFWVKLVLIPHVKHEERFLVGHIGPKEYHMYICIVRYGCHDAHNDDLQFKNALVCSIAKHIWTGKGGLN